MSGNTITCTVVLEDLSCKGVVVKHVQHRNTSLVLGRDEFDEIYLQINIPGRVRKVSVREIVIHSKFIQNGKAGIRFPDEDLLVLMSNCPPDRLKVFIKILQLKLVALQQKGFVNQRHRLLSGLPRSFTEISPLSLKDLHAAKTRIGSCLSDHLKSTALVPEIHPGDRNRKRLFGTALENTENCVTRSKIPMSFKGVSPSRILSRSGSLSLDQRRVMDVVMAGQNVFFTGCAGSGKTFLLKRIIGALPPQHTFVTASTGVAASHIGGTTLHSFAGIGSGTGELHHLVESARGHQAAQQWRKCRHLIIDEISMVDGDFFEKMEAVARAVRGSQHPFGGIQLIVCGDFLQLPPVSKEKSSRFCFQTSAWSRSIRMTLELEEVRRQTDPHFISVLQAVRLGTCPAFVTEALEATAGNRIERNGVEATTLCTHKHDAVQANRRMLGILPGHVRTFTAIDTDAASMDTLDRLCPVGASVQLKIGAQILLCKNMEVDVGLVNGSRGVITAFDSMAEGLPMVRFACGAERVIKPVCWLFKVTAGRTLSRKQIPLKLAWAISIHKSQGMTLDCVEISLSKVFECGQSYVALSRARSLQGLRVLGFRPDCIRADSAVLQFYEKLRLCRSVSAPSV